VLIWYSTAEQFGLWLAQPQGIQPVDALLFAGETAAQLLVSPRDCTMTSFSSPSVAAGAGFLERLLLLRQFLLRLIELGVRV